MLITQILYSGLGGHAAVARALAEEFATHGHINALLFFGVEPLWESSRQWCLEQQVNYAYVSKRPGLDLASWRQVWASLSSWQPDVVLCHGPSTWLPATAHSLLSGKPWFLRDTQVHEGKRLVEKVLTGLSLLSAAGTIFLTQRAAKAAVRGPFRRANTCVIPNGLDLESFRAGPVGPVKTLGMLGRLNVGKDLVTLLQAFELLIQRVPTPLELHIAGEGECRADFERCVRDRGLEGRVRCLGLLPANEVPLFLSTLDVYCHATLGEAMSTSIMQALASGLPTVASDVPGVNDMLIHDVDALLVPAGNAGALAEALHQVVLDAGVRIRLAQAGRSKAVELYCRRRQARQYLDFFVSSRRC